MPMQANWSVTSRTSTLPSDGRCIRIQPRSLATKLLPVVTRKRSGPQRVTVRSLSIPPRGGPLFLVGGMAEHVVVLVRLARALGGVRAVLVHRPEAPQVQLRHVVRRLAVYEPVGDDVADRAAGAEARVREACRDPEPG